MTLTVMALYYLPWSELLGTLESTTTKDNPKLARGVLRNPWPLRASLTLAALAVVLRPTNILVWATIATLAITRLGLRGTSPITAGIVLTFIREAVLCGCLVLALSLCADRLYFGFWTFPPYNWLSFNISKSLAVFYGRNPWHYYITQGLPLLCTTSLPFVVVGLLRPTPSSASQANVLRALSCAAAVTVFALSLISHKEVRFIYPLLPIFNVLAAPVAASFFTIQPVGSSSPPTVRRKALLYLALGINLLLAGYLSFVHQRAPLAVISYLRARYTALGGSPDSPPGPDGDNHLFALFLTPCHSTPWRSHLAFPGLHAYALSCEPPLYTLPGTPERDTYRDEADLFYDDPAHFLSNELFRAVAAGDKATWASLPIPRHIIGFEGIRPWLDDFLTNTPEGRAMGITLRPVWSGFNGFFNEDWRRAGRLVVWDTGVYQDTTTPRLKVTNAEL